MKKDESIVIPRNNIIIDANFNVLSKGYYKAKQSIEIFLASTKEEQYYYWVGKELKVPARSVIKFEGGGFCNGIINMSGSTINSYSNKVLHNTIALNLGNYCVSARWFYEDGDSMNSTIIDNLGQNVIDYEGLKLVSDYGVSFVDANWKNLYLVTPSIVIGNTFPIITPFPVCRPLRKDEYVNSHMIDVDPFYWGTC